VGEKISYSPLKFPQVALEGWHWEQIVKRGIMIEKMESRISGNYIREKR